MELPSTGVVARFEAGKIRAGLRAHDQIYPPVTHSQQQQWRSTFTEAFFDVTEIPFASISLD